MLKRPVGRCGEQELATPILLRSLPYFIVKAWIRESVEHGFVKA